MVQIAASVEGIGAHLGAVDAIAEGEALQLAVTGESVLAVNLHARRQGEGGEGATIEDFSLDGGERSGQVDGVEF